MACCGRTFPDIEGSVGGCSYGETSFQMVRSSYGQNALKQDVSGHGTSEPHTAALFLISSESHPVTGPRMPVLDTTAGEHGRLTRPVPRVRRFGGPGHSAAACGRSRAP